MTSQAGKQIADVLGKLTHMQRLYVKARSEGASKTAAATAAGMANPKHNANKFEESEAVRDALRAIAEITADAIAFSRKDAHEMYMQAYYSAATAAEMVMAINGIVKLHGLAAPEVKELRHKHQGRIEHAQISNMPDSELAKLAQLKDSPFIDAEFEVVSKEKEPSPLQKLPKP